MCVLYIKVTWKKPHLFLAACVIQLAIGKYAEDNAFGQQTL